MFVEISLVKINNISTAAKTYYYIKALARRDYRTLRTCVQFLGYKNIKTYFLPLNTTKPQTLFYEASEIECKPLTTLKRQQKKVPGAPSKTTHCSTTERD